MLLVSGCDVPPAPQNNLLAGPTPTPLTVRQLNDAPPIQLGNSEGSGTVGGSPSRPSNEVLENNEAPGPDGLPNRFFYTPEQARQLGLKRYASGPCKGYYRGEEWWCK
jgi:hypothetical protein